MSLYSRAETQAQSIKVINTTEKASVKKYESDGNLVAHDGNTNATSGAAGSAAVSARILFIDDTEATLAENRERGLTAPGWWQYTTYTDADGETRHKCEHLVSFKDAPANTADQDDFVAADIASAITISAQPADVTGAADPFTGTFAVTAAVAPTGSLTYQWQKQTATGTRWTNVTTAGVFSGATSATLTITGGAKSDLDGYKFRVKINSTVGSEEVTSNTATLTFA